MAEQATHGPGDMIVVNMPITLAARLGGRADRTSSALAGQERIKSFRADAVGGAQSPRPAGLARVLGADEIAVTLNTCAGCVSEGVTALARLPLIGAHGAFRPPPLNVIGVMGMTVPLFHEL